MRLKRGEEMTQHDAVFCLGQTKKTSRPTIIRRETETDKCKQK